MVIDGNSPRSMPVRYSSNMEILEPYPKVATIKFPRMGTIP